MSNNWRRTIARVRFTAGAAIGALCLIGLIIFAIYDSVSSAQTSEQQYRKSTLSAELSNFLLAIREPDGSSLLENPKDFSKAQRPLRFVSLRRPFYSYLLNRANARSLTADNVVWDAPRPCVVEFSKKNVPLSIEVPSAVQTCFAVVPSEVGGHYAYFSIRYPTLPLVRHKPGASLRNADRVVLSFGIERPLVVTLVYEPPILAASRYPSQMERFSGIHEVSAFLNESPDRSLRQINAQAFERAGEGDDRRNFVTIVGRIDARLLDSQSDVATQWPSATIDNMKIGMEIFARKEDGSSESIMQIASGAVGDTLVSLQKAYLSNVTTGSRLDIAQPQKGKSRKVWSSLDLHLPLPPRRAGWSQALSDWWAPKLMALFGQKPEIASVVMDHRIAGPGGDFSATLTAAPVLLPVVATRAFGWLTAALGLVLILAGLGGVAVYRLAHLTQSAWSMALAKNYSIDKQRYGRRRDEISTLGRTLNFLFSRNRSRNMHLVQRIRKESISKAMDLRLMQVQLDLRQDRLDAIGHEIRSPLQTLLNRTKGDEGLQLPLLRMRNAVETIFEAATVEDGINNLEVICARTDVANFLSSLVENKSEVVKGLRYEGPTQDAWSSIDDIKFETVIDHLIDNAQRYRSECGEVIVRLGVREQVVVVEVFNHGKLISEDQLKNLFKYRNSDRSTSRNRGIGLYASRAYLFRMKATIFAENRVDGVTMIIELPVV
jgi:signal transduction histidine kinase